ncbi:hypothetical protein [Metabacillus arenae]|uniref:Uncharacterized protein n=1 Tax=Metabacillus arenae TaxID=2771434 RepID=A0A926RW30_9BACI|nr:hypothetical protein [Metabacillus arenae]MBD1379130.1 hypothetical protein [Metabacillus arenae]
MTNLEKMNELVGTINSAKEQVINWAYMNRIPLCCLCDEQEFEEMENSVEAFMDTVFYMNSDDENEIWDKFLDANYID